MGVKTKCEIFSRVVGYIRPVEAWHEGKAAEFGDRVLFKIFNSKEEANQQTSIKQSISA